MWRRQGGGFGRGGRGRGRWHVPVLKEGEAVLVDLPLNQPAEVVRLAGPRHFTRRLAHMGFHGGVQVRVLQHMGWHALVQVGDCKMGLGMRAASRIVVKLKEGEGKGK